MKIVFNFLLCGGLLFQWNKATAIQYTFKNGDTHFDLTHRMDTHLYLSIQEIRNSVEAAWGRPFRTISFKNIFKKAKKGDQKSRLFLTYLYLDKWFEYRYTDSYPSHFEEMELTDEDIKSIRSFFKSMLLPYEWNFIEGWNEFFLLQNNFHIPEKKLPYLQKSLAYFLMAKEGNHQAFQFPWAFLVIEMRDHVVFEDSALKEAESAIFRLAEDGYAPAQHLMGFIELKNNRILSALDWFQKSYDNDFKRDLCSVAIGRSCMDLKRFSEAIPYLKAAVYEYHYELLKPELMRAYMNEDQIPSAFNVAKEIAENYTKFSLDVSLNSMRFLSFILFAGQGTKEDLLESYTWLNRARHIEEENNVSIIPEHDHSDALKSTLSLLEQREAERRSKNLHQPAKMYSQMDTHLNNECEITFH